MELDCHYDFNEMVEEFLQEYELDYNYEEEEDLYFTGVCFDDLQNVSILIINNGSKISIVGEIDYEITNDRDYLRTSNFVHRFNAMDCTAVLFLDPDHKRLYYKKNVNVFEAIDPQLSFAKDFFRTNLEMDLFGNAIMGVMQGMISDEEAIEEVQEAVESLNTEVYEDMEQYMS